MDGVGGRFTCLGDNEPAAPEGDTIVLSGYVRALSDPGAIQLTLEAPLEVFGADGASVGNTASDPSDSGRVAVTVSVDDAGFAGWANITHSGYLDLRLASSRAATSSELTAWAFMITPEEADAETVALGLSRDPGLGVVVGSVHDCDGFGSDNAVVTLNGAPDDVAYVSGFSLSPTATYTASSGRFVFPNVAVGPVTIQAWGRADANGPLELLSAIDTVVAAGTVSAVSLEPRAGRDH